MKITYRIWLLGLTGALCLGQFAASARTEDNIKVELKGYTTSTIAGIPVAVALSIRNQGPTAAVVFDRPIDPFSDMWEWRSSAGRIHRIFVRDYNQLPVPQPSAPRDLSLSPGEGKTWTASVPSPFDVDKDEEWTLTATTRVQRDVIMRASATFRIRVAQNLCVTNEVEPALAQAAALGFERYGAIPKLEREKKFGAIQTCADQGDPLARLILFSKSLVDGKSIVEHWQAAESSSPEIKCLRNYLLALALTSGRITEDRIPTADRKAILPLIGKEDFFAAELVQSLTNSPRASETSSVQPQQLTPQLAPERLAAE